jgi:ferredoxin
MPAIMIDRQLCDLCGECISVCGIQGLSQQDGQIVMLDAELCMVCKACESACHALAIQVFRDSEIIPAFDPEFVTMYTSFH